MRKTLSTAAALFVLFSSAILMGCPKKAPSVEGSAGLSREQSETTRRADPSAPSDDVRSLPPPPQEERLDPLAKEAPMSDEMPSGETAGGEGGHALQDVFFEFDQWVIRPESRKRLESDAEWLAAHPEAKVQIEGHADERGTEEYNLALGERRAKSVMNFLVNLGISPTRLSSISYGEEKPFCNENSERCYEQNRRAHFVVVPR